MNTNSTFFIFIYGLVQGVGFRPFLAALAEKCGIAGNVKNDGGIVVATVNGTDEQIDTFISRVKREAPPGAVIEKVDRKEAPAHQFFRFDIIESAGEAKGTPVIPADLTLCGDCRKELYDPANRRYKNPFISCVSCGPRYSIMEDLPYDRCRTAMSDYAMCGCCAEEYNGSGRRDFAQTISCNDCGPVLLLQTKGKSVSGETALGRAADILLGGGVLAVKGIGGYHFVCSPFSQSAVMKLRLLKKRDKKPFAVQFKSVEEIRNYCAVSRTEEELLASSPRPVVLLPFNGGKIDPGVCGESRYLGAFLPYTPLQELMMDACGPLVMTSANVTEQPLLTADEDVLAISSVCLDGVLYNTRRIIAPLDDSVARVIRDKTQWIRRSRGIVPLPISLRESAALPLFAAGGDLKSSFCLMEGNKAYMSQYFGDLQNPDAAEVYRNNYKRMRKLFSIHPALAVCDMHPDYLSAHFARETGMEFIAVQHHHAHIASVMAEHSLAGPAIGIAFDGTGYGVDGNIWGGEILLCEGSGFIRMGHLSYVPMFGGENAARDAALCADSYLACAGMESLIEPGRFALMQAALKHRTGIFQSSSMGRLFDAVSSILEQKKYNSFEGECAIALENLAMRALEQGKNPYPLYFELREEDGVWIADQSALIRDILAAMQSGVDAGAIAAGFHRAIVWMVIHVCERLREQRGTHTVALSGGVFANRLLLEDCMDGLMKNGFIVFINQAVPMNDGGIALGQAFIASRRINERKSV